MKWHIISGLQSTADLSRMTYNVFTCIVGPSREIQWHIPAQVGRSIQGKPMPECVRSSIDEIKSQYQWCGIENVYIMCFYQVLELFSCDSFRVLENKHYRPRPLNGSSAADDIHSKPVCPT